MSGSASDTPQPGEIDLETGVVEEPAAEPAAEPVAEPVAAAEPAAEPVEEPEAPAEPAAPAPEKRKPTGAVAELIAKREETRLLREQLQRYENNPALRRLTPELEAAIAEGRIVVQPPKSNLDEERERLKQTAEELGLLKQDGTPDIEAAGRVDRVIQRQVKQAIAPVVERTRTVEHQTLTEKAHQNIAEAVRAAEANGYDKDFVQAEFTKALHAPNGAAMLANGEIAMQIWDATLGKLVRAGKMPQAAPAAEPAKPAKGAPVAAPVIAEPTGRRGPSAGVVLSPALKSVYAAHGLDPAKAFSTTKGSVDLTQGVELE